LVEALNEAIVKEFIGEFEKHLGCKLELVEYHRLAHFFQHEGGSIRACKN